MRWQEMDKNEKRHIVEIAIIISLTVLNPILLIITIPIAIITTVDITITKKRKIEKKDIRKKVPIENENNIEEIKSIIEEIEEEKQKEEEYKRNLKLEEFENRENIKNEEVERYINIHKNWEGKKEKEWIIEEIKERTKSENINKNEIIRNNLNNGGSWIRNEELKNETEYERNKTKNKIKNYEKQIENEIRKINGKSKELIEKIERKNENEEYEYIYEYEEWLKRR